MFRIHHNKLYLFLVANSSSAGKESACSAEDPGLIPGSRRSPGEGKGHPLQYSCLGNPMDRGAWWATVHGVARVRHGLATKPPPSNIMQGTINPSAYSCHPQLQY